MIDKALRMFRKVGFKSWPLSSDIGLFLLGMLLASGACGPTAWAGPAQAAPTQAVPGFCELAALPALPLAADSTERFTPEELLNRVALSYRGLLEFAGDEFSEVRLAALLVDVPPITLRSRLEEFFEPVTVAEQRSVALNESLTKLGDWVMLEAEEHGLTQNAILARLRETVQTHLQRSKQEQERTRDTREERREPPPVTRQFEPFADVNATGVRSAIVGEENIFVTGTHNHAVRRWNFSDFTSAGELGFPEDLNISTDGGILPVPIAMGNTEQVLIQYVRSPIVEVWDARTLTRVGHWNVGQNLGSLSAKISSSLRFIATQSDEKSVSTILDLMSGQIFHPPYQGRVHRQYWSGEGDYLAVVSGAWAGPGQLEIFRFDTDLNGTSRMVSTLAAPLESSGVKVAFGFDHEHLLICNDASIQSYRIVGDQLLPEWTHERPGIPIYDSAELRSTHSGAREIIYSTPQSIDLLNPVTGDLIKSLEIPAPWSVSRVLQSPSGRFLAVRLTAESGKKGAVWVWNLETRTVHAKLNLRVLDITSFSNNETELSLQVGGGRSVMVWDFGSHEFE